MRSGSKRNILCIILAFMPFFTGLKAQEIELDRIIVRGDSILFDQARDGGSGDYDPLQFSLPNHLNHLRFEVKVYPYPANLQFFLEGLDLDWSPWSDELVHQYSYVPEGSYKLLVRLKDYSGVVTEKTVAGFEVLPSLYRSKGAWLVYILLFLIAGWTFLRIMILNFARVRYRLEKIINLRTEQLISEKDKSEKLLANVLPKGMADELKDKGKVSKKKYNLVTVLFSDIQGFTRIAEEMNPETLIDELDKFFFHFDSVVEKYNIEKIKTIGDAYMCAGGIPVKNRTNPVEVVLSALEMQEYMKVMEEQTAVKQQKFWDIRIGIHTGTVIAGVVGSKKLSYDIWGDTVNTASRMESSGEPGRVNISGMTYELVRDFFICEYRGKMPVKYKGEIDMYFVNGIRPELSGGEGVSPNRAFILKMQLLRLLDVEESVFSLIEEKQAQDLVFHNLRFIKNVCTQTELISRAEGLGDEDNLLLRTAAIFLNVGYVLDYEKREEAVLQFIDEELPRFRYSESQIKIIKALVTSDYDPESEDLKTRILHDANMDYLGRVDFIQRSTDLMEEMNRYNKQVTAEQWFAAQAKLLREHAFMTKTACMLRSVPAEEQIQRIQKLYPAIQ